jgi:hypothetical protein
VHGLIGLIEATLTVSAVAAVSQVGRAMPRWSTWAAAATVLGMVPVAVFGASPWPDGLEHSVEANGISAVAGDLAARAGWVQEMISVAPDYTLLPTLAATVALGMAALACVSAVRRRGALA